MQRKQIKGKYKRGFKYEAFVGYTWIKCEYPKTGFSKEQIEDAFKIGIAREIKPRQLTS